MTKTIETLIEDMEATLRGDRTPLEVCVDPVARRIGEHVDNTLNKERKPRTEARVWFSQLGTKCLRKEWYVAKDEEQEPLTASAKYKFLYGNTIEELTLHVAKAAGHRVEREQEKVELPFPHNPVWSVTGRIDAMIDGRVVDVKSMSSYSFKAGVGDDLFGYHWQIGAYAAVLTPGEPGFILGVDKQLGHIKLVDVPVLDVTKDVLPKALEIATAMTQREPPERLTDEPMGASGNRKLGIVCSYCGYRSKCWPSARVFLYSGKPTYLTEVKLEPKVPELTKDGLSL